jgi:hypothetical protein
MQSPQRIEEPTDTTAAEAASPREVARSAASGRDDGYKSDCGD